MVDSGEGSVGNRHNRGAMKPRMFTLQIPVSADAAQVMGAEGFNSNLLR